jgi:hypothetical protein
VTEVKLELTRDQAVPVVRSSSPRGPGICDATIVRTGQVIGPVRLPEHRGDDFVSHFNRTYRSIGMQLKAVE